MIDEQSPEHMLAGEILAELERARAKFPGDNVTTLALVEEVGELAKAVFSESRAAVRAEAVQVACMAMRVVLDGDVTVADWRHAKGLDPLVGEILMTGPRPFQSAHGPLKAPPIPTEEEYRMQQKAKSDDIKARWDEARRKAAEKTGGSHGAT